MARITLRQLLDHAAEHDYGVPAFNINNMEQGLAIMAAAASVDAPVIIQASRGARAYANDIVLAKLIEALIEMYPDIPVCMHQDHGNSEATCFTALQYGFSSVMMDGSLEADAATPASYDYNVGITAKVVEVAHAVGASVEGELGVLGSLEHGTGEQEDGHGAAGKLSLDQLLTDPDQAVDFVTRTKVDALAIAMGTSHGAYKFTRKPDGDILSMRVVEAIHAKLPNIHLVMHGSSSVPQQLQDRFNAYGGAMRQTYGVPVEEIVRGIKHGVRKVNIDTDCRLAMTAELRRVAHETPGEFDPRKFLKPAMDAMRAVCKQRLEQFGTAGHASKIKVLPMSAMAKRYASGSLDPAIVALDLAAEVRITDPVCHWRDAVVRRLNDLVALKRGWDGYTGEAVTFENAKFALRMLEASCGAEAPVPQIVPGAGGDLQVEWHIGRTDIELDIRGPNDVHAWICSEHTGPDGQEVELTNDFTIVAKWIRDLSDSSNVSSIAAA